MKTKIKVSGYFEQTGSWNNKGWYYTLCDKGDSMILSMKKFPTKKAAIAWAEELEKKVVPFLKSRQERGPVPSGRGYISEIINGFSVDYPMVYTPPMGSGMGCISLVG